MSFKDIIKNSVLNSFSGGASLSLWDVCLILLVSCLVGIYIFFIYKNFARAEFYSKSLNITMTGMVVVVAAIMVAMQSNLLVSLGMVGALSIVRFRTAVKSPIDLLYLFWAISEGIICDVALYLLGIVLCIMMTIILFVLGKIPYNKTEALLILKTDMNILQDELSAKIHQYCKYAKSTSVIVRNGECETIYEIETKQKDELIRNLASFDGVKSVNFVDNSGSRRI